MHWTIFEQHLMIRVSGRRQYSLHRYIQCGRIFAAFHAPLLQNRHFAWPKAAFGLVDKQLQTTALIDVRIGGGVTGTQKGPAYVVPAISITLIMFLRAH